MKNKAFAGVGIPIKLVLWFVSILNFAKRRAENIGIRSAKNGLIYSNKYCGSSFCVKKLPDSILKISWKIMIEGATPKLIRSAKLSSCFPKSPLTLNNLASIPSKKSKNWPIIMNIPASVKCAWNARNIAINPQLKLESVKILGICFWILKKYGYLLCNNTNRCLKNHYQLL